MMRLGRELLKTGRALSMTHYYRAIRQMKAAFGPLVCPSLTVSGNRHMGAFTTGQEDASEAVQALTNFVVENASAACKPAANTLKCKLAVRRRFIGIWGFTDAEASAYVSARRCPCGAPLPRESAVEDSVFLPVHLPGDTDTERSLADLLAVDSARTHGFECANKYCKSSKHRTRVMWEVEEQWRLAAAEQDVVLVQVVRFTQAASGAMTRNDGLVQPSTVFDLPVAAPGKPPETVRYVLKGVILQQGSISTGHIVAMMQHGGRWVLYDDHRKVDLGAAAPGAEPFEALASQEWSEKWQFAKHCYLLLLQRVGTAP